ncbi:ABC-2 transporter permease [Christensenellaceae bacterium OttesenSCG-928-L17]|nr:ABC-2 transporter permease [Christensenellaceae bacterium OttesenSCG-928-L17]
MKGLFLKDLRLLKSTLRMLAVMFALMIGAQLYSFSVEEAGLEGFHVLNVVYLVSSILSITTLAFDERSGWMRFALTTPLTRAKLVLSKYLLGLVFPLGLMLVSSVFMLALSDFTLAVILPMFVLPMCMGLLMQAILLPLSFRFGTEKTRILMMIFAGGGATFLVSSNLLDMNLSFLSNSALLLLGSLVLYAVSIAVSLQIYKKKDFS